jgi:hypothetical protein
LLGLEPGCIPKHANPLVTNNISLQSTKSHHCLLVTEISLSFEILHNQELHVMLNSSLKTITTKLEQILVQTQLQSALLWQYIIVIHTCKCSSMNKKELEFTPTNILMLW